MERQQEQGLGPGDVNLDMVRTWMVKASPWSRSINASPSLQLKLTSSGRSIVGSPP